MNSSLYSPFLCPQQVPGTPFLDVSTSSITIGSPGYSVPDIDDHSGTFRQPYGRRTPKSAPCTPGMTVPSSAHSRDTLTHKPKHKEKNIHVETPKREQIVPSCSPQVNIHSPTRNGNNKSLDNGAKDQHSTKQISLFTGEDIFA